MFLISVRLLAAVQSFPQSDHQPMAASLSGQLLSPLVVNDSLDVIVDVKALKNRRIIPSFLVIISRQRLRLQL